MKAILHGHSQERVAMALLTAFEKSDKFSHYCTKREGEWPELFNFKVLFKLTRAGQ